MPDNHDALRQTLAGQSLQQLRQLARQPSRTAPAPLPEPPADEQPLSFAQERLWFMDQLAPGNASYNLPFRLDFEGPLQAGALAAAFEHLCQATPTLNACFTATPAGPRVRPALAPARCTILRPAGEQAVVEALQQAGLAEATRPFDLGTGPLARATLILASPTRAHLVYGFHHIAFDGWSIGLFNQALCQLYQKAITGAPLAVASAEGPSFAAFAAWQRAQMGDIDAPTALARTLQARRVARLQDSSTLQPPVDFARPVRQTFAGASLSLTLDATLADAARNLARRVQATPFAVWMTLYQVTLQRWCHQDDLVVGTSVAGRLRPDCEALIGFFVNNLALRSRLQLQQSLADQVRGVQEQLLAELEDQALPFQMLVDALDEERRLDVHPVYQTAFTFQNAPLDPAWSWPDLQVRAVPVPVQACHMDLECLVWPEPDLSLTALFIYASDLFSEDTVQQFADLFRDTAAILLAQSESPQQQVLAQLPPALLSGPPQPALSTTLWDCFQARAQQHPDRSALVQGAVSYSAAQALAQATHYSEQLWAAGCRPGEVVGVRLAASPALPLVTLAIWRCGATVVMLDPRHPARHNAWLLHHAGITRVVSDSAGWRDFAHLGLPCLDPHAGAQRQPLPAGLRPADCAAIVYTSGSTGHPKGVRLRAEALLRRLHWMWQHWPFADDEWALQKTAPSFVDLYWETFGPLLGGCPLVIADPDQARDPAALVQLMGQHRISRLVSTPAVLAAILDTPGSDCALAGIRVLISSGERLDGTLAARIRDLLDPAACFLNLYGSSEVTADATAGSVGDRPGRPLARQDSVAIGQPLPQTQIRIMAPHGQPLPAGCIGEMWVQGACLAEGYQGDEALTASRFPDWQHQRWYATGDLASLSADGVLVHRGRADRQVKVRGIRLEPGDIERQLCRHEQVREALVQALPASDGSTGGERLVAWFIPAQTSTSHDEAQQVVQHWREVYDDLYRQVAAQGSVLDDFRIWESSYDGSTLSDADMKEWIQSILALVAEAPARRPVEIGCGQGFLALPLLEQADVYQGLDVSPAALECIQAVVPAPHRHRVQLHAGSADQLSMLADGCADVTLLNSIVQYFPNEAYLLHALEEAIRITASGGRVILGDLRHLDTLPLLHLGAQLQRCNADTPLADVAERARLRARLEGELCLTPGWLEQLPQRAEASPWLQRIAAVTVMPKRGQADNELTQFRYEAVLWLDQHSVTRTPASRQLDWTPDQLDEQRLEHALQALPGTGSLTVTAIPHRRLSALQALFTRLGPDWPGADDDPRNAGDGREWLQQAPRQGMDPEALHALASRHGRCVDLRFNAQGQGTRLDATFRPPAQPPQAQAPGQSRINDPAAIRQQDDLKLLLRDHLRERLPEALVPDLILPVDAWPLTPSGKIDRRRLPSPARRGHSGSTPLTVPDTDSERQLADIWRRTLGLDEVGIHDGFFDIGGNSILLTQLHRHIQEHFQREFPLAILFEQVNIADQARWLTGRTDGDRAHQALSRASARRAVRKRQARQPGHAATQEDLQHD